MLKYLPDSWHHFRRRTTENTWKKKRKNEIIPLTERSFFEKPKLELDGMLDLTLFVAFFALY